MPGDGKKPAWQLLSFEHAMPQHTGSAHVPNVLMHGSGRSYRQSVSMAVHMLAQPEQCPDAPTKEPAAPPASSHSVTVTRAVRSIGSMTSSILEASRVDGLFAFHGQKLTNAR